LTCRVHDGVGRHHFEDKCYFHFQGKLKLQAVFSCKSLANIYQTTRRNVPKYFSILFSPFVESQISQIKIIVFRKLLVIWNISVLD
jgi:hypothetical protein